MDHRAAAEYVARELRASAGDAVDRIVLYGSVARGEETSQSDVDMVVITHDFRRIRHALRPILGHLLTIGAPVMGVMILTRGEVEQMEREGSRFWDNVTAEGESYA